VQHPPLPKEIVVLHGTDVEDAWQRFHPFEALHHLHTICNPLTSDDLDLVINVLDPKDGDQALDLACGHGELLHRLTGRAAVGATGVDLSPWVLIRAAAKSPTIAWWLGDAADVPSAPDWDIVTCLGGSWIWNGFAGTAAALAARTAPGGRLAVGDLRLRSPADRVALGNAPEAATLTDDEQADVLRSLGLEPVEQVVPDEAGWRAYHELVIESANVYAAAHPGDPSADHRAMAQAWMRNDYERLRRHLVWTIWVADKPVLA
jgi:SAM-dependent methyltransferase